MVRLESSLRWIRIITIFAFGAVAALLAWHLYPHDYPQQPATDVAEVTFDTDVPFTFGMDASSLAVDLSPSSAGGTKFKTYGPPTPYEISIAAPLGAWGATNSCGNQKTIACNPVKELQHVYAEFPSHQAAEGPQLVSNFSVPGVSQVGGYPVTRSNAYASIQLPGVDLQDSGWTYSTPNPGANIPVVISIHLPGWKRFSWSGGPTPGDGQTVDDMSFVEVTDATGAIPAVIESGVSQQQLHADATLTLMAGALVGLAGAAVIALLQEIRREEAR
jgi:hypothetical protein